MSTTLLPFLYQTRTIQRLSQTRLSTPALRAFFHATARAADKTKKNLRGNAIPFEFPPGTEHLDPDLAIENIPPGHRPTITPAERSAFNRIFEEIAARGGRPPAPSPAQAPSKFFAAAVDAAICKPVASTPDVDAVESAHDELGIIIQDAAAAQDGSHRPTLQPFSQKHLVGQVTAATDPMKALMRFPPSLRQAAREALGALETERAVEEEGSVAGRGAASPLTAGIEMEKQRGAERRRVEQKMVNAKSDFELWDVLEEEVFSMVSRLGLGSQAAPATTKKRRSKNAAGAGDQQQLSMNVHGPLYPAHLLTAIRLMDSKFARSSHLALNILPRIKALGVSSYVLGVSTSFYNALAEVYWYRHGNAEAVFNLLEEMRHAGLFCDGDTYSLVQDIANVFKKAASGAKGPFLRELASLPEYEFAIGPRINHWLKTTSMHLAEQRDMVE